MSLLFMDGFDHYATGDILEKWTQIIGTGGNAYAIGAYGRNSSNGLRVHSLNLAVAERPSITLAPGDASFYIGFAFMPEPNLADLTANHIVQIGEGATAHVSLKLNTNGTLSVMRGTGGGTTLGTTAFALSENTYYYVEIGGSIHDTTGAVTVRVNGDPKLTLTSVDTRNGATGVWDYVAIGGLDVVTNGDEAYWRFDDLYVCDGTGSAPHNTFLGDVRVISILPDGAGATTQFTPSAGSNYQNVDEATPDDDTTYNASNTAGHKDTYTYGNVGVAGTVHGVQACVSAKKTDAGTRTIAAVARPTSTDYDGTTQALGTTYTYYRQIWALNPATAAAWTTAEVDAAQFGAKVVA